ncbi:MAG: conserved phage C-terminal domain-containing protein [Syntrophaceae bacterium]|nr:conserved phage C-terminal domain-containing protein [Syntrophaceae bacterium]
MIKVEILPYDDCDIESLLDQLCEAGLIIRYEIEGVHYGCVPKFLKHQKPHVREAESTIPAPDSQTQSSILVRPGHDLGDAKEDARHCQDALNPSSLNPSSLNPSSLNPSSLNPSSLNEESPELDSGLRPSNGGPPLYAEIIVYLNSATGKDFKLETKATRRLIKARWVEGFRLEHFKAVIDRKVRKWGNDPKMMDYLRPETLFGPKFDSYLNEVDNPLQGVVSDVTSRTLRNLDELELNP